MITRKDKHGLCEALIVIGRSSFIESPFWALLTAHGSPSNEDIESDRNDSHVGNVLERMVSTGSMVSVGPSRRGRNAPEGPRIILSDVTMHALEDCTHLSWPIENLEVFFKKNPDLAMAFNALVSADVASRLLNPHKPLSISTQELRCLRQPESPDLINRNDTARVNGRLRSWIASHGSNGAGVKATENRDEALELTDIKQ